VQNFVLIGQIFAEILQSFDFFFKTAAVCHPRFVMCKFGPATSMYLVIFITVQNLVGIDASVDV